jgi:hypothetical protein
MLRHTAMLFALVLPAAPLGLATRTYPAPAAAATAETVVGRWDFVVQTPERPLPSWLEVRKSGNGYLVGQFVGSVGSARPVARVDTSGNTMRFAIPPQWEQGKGDMIVEGRLEAGQLAGTITMPDGKQFPYTAKRAPLLRRPTPTWGTPIRLLNTKDLSGWHALGSTNQWLNKNGVLTSPKSGANLVTDRTFDDFKLHIEFRYPKGSNSGVYLRGRYEVQIEDSIAPQPEPDMLGGVYGFLAPSEIAAKPAGTWQTYDITLVGRMVTVVLNGKTIISHREIPGITGGALDADESAPGPLQLQGDHGPIEFRNIVITPGK